MHTSHFFKRHLLFFVTLCLALQPLSTFPATQQAPEQNTNILFQEKRLSPTLQSPTRSDFGHIADYWLENYASTQTHKTAEEAFTAKLQIKLLPVIMSGQHEESTDPVKRLYLLKELQLLNTPGNKSIFANIDNTITQAGKISLCNLVATENTNWAVIKERQNFIKHLIGSPIMLKDIQSHLYTIKGFEHHSIQAMYRAEELHLEKELIKANLRLNGLAGCVGYGIFNFYERYIYKIDSLNTLSKFFVSLGMVIAVPTLCASAVVCVAGAFVAGKIAAAPLFILYSVISAGSAFFTYESIKLRNKALKTNFEIAKNTAQVIRHVQYLHTLLAADSGTQHLYPHIPATTSLAWKQLVSKAKASTFDPQVASSLLFTNHGRVENLINLCGLACDEIGQITRFYGELDAHASLAQLYLNHQDTKNHLKEKITYCLADLQDQQQASMLVAKKFWHPIIPTDRVRPSSLDLGGPNNHARNLVITGPNAGGKSVNLKALFVNLILAQSCGMACAEKLSFTPFKKLIGRFRGVDDITNDKSKFMLEAIEMAGLLKEMMSLKPGEHAFVETDELFTGTEIAPAISLSIELCTQIAQMQNVIYILATHYKQLTDLSLITGGIFTNYKVDVFKDKDSHKLIYPYQLKPGIGTTNVAFDIFLEQLDQQGVDDPTLTSIITKARSRQESIECAL